MSAYHCSIAAIRSPSPIIGIMLLVYVARSVRAIVPPENSIRATHRGSGPTPDSVYSVASTNSAPSSGDACAGGFANVCQRVESGCHDPGSAIGHSDQVFGRGNPYKRHTILCLFGVICHMSHMTDDRDLCSFQRTHLTRCGTLRHHTVRSIIQRVLVTPRPVQSIELYRAGTTP